MDNLVYVGTYTDARPLRPTPASPEAPVMGMTGPTGSEGIYVFRQDDAGALHPVRRVGGVLNPSFLALDPHRRRLFAVNECLAHPDDPAPGPDADPGAGGAVSSFAVEGDDGALRFLSRQASGGGNPCHLCPDASGRFLLVANHEHGRVGVLPIGEDGRLGPLADVRQQQVADPAGGRRPHAHFVTPDPAGRFILATDTGADRVFVYRLDPTSGRLTPNEPPWGQTHRGAGPRHLAFHPNGRFVYANGEADMTLTVFAYDAGPGALTPLQAASTLPEGTAAGAGMSTAQVRAHPSGRFVYVSNRGHDSIAVFAVEGDGAVVRQVAVQPCGGRTPRTFDLDPAGRFLYVANQNSDTIVPFAVDGETGRLHPAGPATAVPAPTCVLFAGGAA